MSSGVVKHWFGDQFSKLHPLLQQLHLTGGQLSGMVQIAYGEGLAGVFGRRLAKKMCFPGPGSHYLKVFISHDDKGLHWSRTFDDLAPVVSLFTPVGTITSGYWLESTGPLRMKLTVDILDGGWYWRCLSVSVLGIPIPSWLMPQTNAYKKIEDGQYLFHVGFTLPLLGQLVSYQGLLKPESAQ